MPIIAAAGNARLEYDIEYRITTDSKEKDFRIDIVYNHLTIEMHTDHPTDNTDVFEEFLVEHVPDIAESHIRH